MCEKGNIKKIKKIEKVEDKPNNRTNAEVKYVTADGEERGTAFVNFDSNFKEVCEECGRKLYKCRLEKEEANRSEPAQTDVRTDRERKDVTTQYK